jgi:hypothetical protein
MNSNNYYFILGAFDWSYNLVFKVNSSSIFNYLINDDQNVLEFRSYKKIGNYSLDEEHSLQIYSSDVLTDSYKIKWFTNYEKTGWILYIL